jgi:thiamine-phosphate pyrophosphorylase
MQNKLINYLITDPKYYGSDLEKFSNTITESYSNHRVDFAAFRDKVSKDIDRYSIASKFVKISNRFNVKPFINSDIELALRSNAYGVHLNSTQMRLIVFAKLEGLKTIISTHSVEEIELANSLEVDYVTYSPIYSSPNKGTPKGIDELKKVTKLYPNVIALGGIVNSTQIDEVKEAKAIGFASIRYFI